MVKSKLGSHLSPATRERVLVEADQITARRALFGTALPVIVVLTFTFGVHDPRIRGTATLLAVTLVVLAAIRFSTALSLLRLPADSSKRVFVRRGFFGSVVATLGLLAIFVGWAIFVLNVTVVTSLMLVTISALAAGATYSFAAHRWLMRSVVSLLILCPLAAVWLVDSPYRALAGTLLAVYLAFLWNSANRMYDEYWTASIARGMADERGEELAKSRAQLRDVIENSPDALGLLRDGRIVFANAAWSSQLEFPVDEIVGKKMSELVHPDDLDAFEEQSSVGGGAPPRVREVRMRQHGGGTCVWEISPAREIDYDSGPARLIVARDVTERNRMRASLLLTDRLSSLGTLAAGIAHEINNPLTYVMGNLDVIRLGLGQRDDARAVQEAVDDACQGATRVRDIVRDLKAFTRMEETRVTGVDANAIVEFALKMSANQLRARASVELRLGRIPPVLANEGKLGQVLLNLLVNAALAIPEGCVQQNRVTASTELDAAGNVLVRISDTGEGIRPENLARIFDPFFTTRPVGLGTGLGLFVCHTIVTGFGGSISVESEVGRGTTFSVLLKPASLAALPVAVEERAPMPPSRPRALVIDDEPMIAKTIAAALRKTCDVVIETSSPRALERLLAQEHFDIVLCDLMMPELTGMDLHERLVAADSACASRMAFMTGGAFTQRASEFLGRVPNERIEKPFGLSQVQGFAARLMQRTN